jgi:hypothetical protein
MQGFFVRFPLSSSYVGKFKFKENSITAATASGSSIFAHDEQAFLVDKVK